MRMNRVRTSLTLLGIVIGALPLSRSGFLPRALVEFRARHPTLSLRGDRRAL